MLIIAGCGLDALVEMIWLANCRIYFFGDT